MLFFFNFLPEFCILFYYCRCCLTIFFGLLYFFFEIFLIEIIGLLVFKKILDSMLVYSFYQLHGNILFLNVLCLIFVFLFVGWLVVFLLNLQFILLYLIFVQIHGYILDKLNAGNLYQRRGSILFILGRLFLLPVCVCVCVCVCVFKSEFLKFLLTICTEGQLAT